MTSTYRIEPATDNAPTPQDAAAANLAFLTRIHNELNNGPLNLPCFPDIVPRVQQAMIAVNSSVKDIVKIICTEPRLTARLYLLRYTR